MPKTILVLNAGSSSLKFAVFELAGDPTLHVRGSISALDANPRMKIYEAGSEDIEVPVKGETMDIKTAMALVLDQLSCRGHLKSVVAVGHRIVHGGGEFADITVLDQHVINDLRKLIPLAPMHQPRNLEIVAEAMRALPKAIQYGCFDTAFHHSRPRIASLYGLPRSYADHGLISYGFHGISYGYIASRLRAKYGHLAGGGCIVAHLGSGASLCAMQGGVSVATTMGFSTLDGLLMGTRCGALDPGVVLYLLQEQGMSADAIADLLYNQSGLLGISGLSADMQVLINSTEIMAKEAIDLFVYRTSQQIGAMAASLGGVDTLVFCAGIGENSPLIREKIGAATKWLGVKIDKDRNWKGQEDITASHSKVKVLVIATDEELAVAQDVSRCIQQTPQ
ncbi:acetate/propionate family kinase [Phyllobacterium sp. P30BS-XVII]|uniref:acetate/propionate family kinase n=1 Tax=Phyllobacterium sp. P30BS-XVII TaxID=2587046 RepID=UPI000DDE128A|nr:acetate/propionate family kinase [Phyllobacterium sp. P30BS-XVII]MBA8903152.1 acetate kinase [Phyllobacterium sp. P30BS-XVII]